MIKRSLLLAGLLIFASIFQLRADEGMWLPMLIKRLNQRNLKEMGLQLTPEEIYSVNNSSLKDAIVSMGGFCTGEMISGQGLMLTNHHCGFDAIRENSTVEDDYLTNGFWAMNMKEELPNEGLFVSFLVRMEDVTAQMNEALEGLETEVDRNAKIAEMSRAIADQAEEGNGYDAEVKSFYAGNEFYLFVYERFTDVRLVGAPPQSVGKFGGDTDNWMWPRHTGDFSLFRVYAGPDGKPAEYSPDNVPLVPKHHLPVSIRGIEEGDFTLTFGFPGSTDRYLTSWGVEQALEKKNPTIVSIRDVKLDVLRKDMKADDAVRLMYASKFAQIANYWKYFIGQTEQLKHLDVKSEKEALEQKFQAWADADPERKAKYGDALEMIRTGFEMKDNTVIGGTYVIEGGLTGADAVLQTYRLTQAFNALMGMDEGPDREGLKDRLKPAAAEFFEETHMPTDQKLFAVTQKLYAENVDADQQPAYMQEMGETDWDAYAKKVYSESIFTDSQRLSDFIDNPDSAAFADDPMRKIATDLFEVYSGQSALNAEANAMLAKGTRLFQAGLREMMPEKEFYPDANSTLRASLGNVRAYEPKDGVVYKYYTTLDGKMAKEDPDDDEFIVPEGISALYDARDYGQYADADGNLPVNFISTNDITGGNSGSPVINGQGELIGLAFDGNWEAMSGDINFEPSVQRTISVDVRYVLWVIDKYADAGHLIDEMTLVTDKKSSKKARKNAFKN
ncbi:MAG: S46 family peptidase [Cryomorphaceae bacterium]|nr:S46 family peptidase [Flavobacteriales bacterium]